MATTTLLFAYAGSESADTASICVRDRSPMPQSWLLPSLLLILRRPDSRGSLPTSPSAR